jgi:hypothetical protein
MRVGARYTCRCGGPRIVFQAGYMVDLDGDSLELPCTLSWHAVLEVAGCGLVTQVLGAPSPRADPVRSRSEHIN